MGQADELLGIGVALEWNIIWVFHETAIFHKFTGVLVEDSVDHGDEKKASGESLGGECQLGGVGIG